MHTVSNHSTAARREPTEGERERERNGEERCNSVNTILSLSPIHQLQDQPMQIFNRHRFQALLA